MAKIIDNYILLESICQGEFGEVHKGRNLISKEAVAVKTIQMEQFLNDPMLRDMIINEIQALKKLDDPAIVRMIKMLKSSNNIYLIYEFLQGRNLKKLLQARQRLSEADSMQVLEQICLGLERLQREKITKRNLNSSNVHVISEPGGDQTSADGGVFSIKLKNFFVCRNAASTASSQITNSSKSDSFLLKEFHYVAPEILGGSNPSENSDSNTCDVFSAAVIFYEMLFGRLPFQMYANTPQDLLDFYANNDISNLIRQDIINSIGSMYLSFLSETSQSILLRALVVDKSRRMSLQELQTLIYSIQPQQNGNNNTNSNTVKSVFPNQQRNDQIQQQASQFQQQYGQEYQSKGFLDENGFANQKQQMSQQQQFSQSAIEAPKINNKNANTNFRVSEIGDKGDNLFSDNKLYDYDTDSATQPVQDQQFSNGKGAIGGGVGIAKKTKTPNQGNTSLNSNTIGNITSQKPRGRTMPDTQGEQTTPVAIVSLNNRQSSSKDVLNQAASFAQQSMQYPGKSTSINVTSNIKDQQTEKSAQIIQQQQTKRYSSAEHSSKLLANSIPSNLSGDKKAWEITVSVVFDEIMDKRSKIQVLLGALSSCMDQDEWTASALNAYSCGYILLKKACALSGILLQIFEQPEIALCNLNLSEAQLAAWALSEKKQLPIKTTIKRENDELNANLFQFQENFGADIQYFVSNTDDSFNSLLFETSKEMAALSAQSKVRKTLVLAHFLADIAFIDIMYSKFLGKKRLDVLNHPYFKKLSEISREKLQENLLNKFKLYEYHKTSTAEIS